MRLRRPEMNVFGHLHELQTYHQQYKMAAILIAILDFVHFLVLEFLDNHFNRFHVPWNICLDTLFVLLAGLYTNLW